MEYVHHTMIQLSWTKILAKTRSLLECMTLQVYSTSFQWMSILTIELDSPNLSSYTIIISLFLITAHMKKETYSQTSNREGGWGGEHMIPGYLVSDSFVPPPSTVMARPACRRIDLVGEGALVSRL